jgi:hypothetical protein
MTADLPMIKILNVFLVEEALCAILARYGEWIFAVRVNGARAGWECGWTVDWLAVKRGSTVIWRWFEERSDGFSERI